MVDGWGKREGGYTARSGLESLLLPSPPNVVVGEGGGCDHATRKPHTLVHDDCGRETVLLGKALTHVRLSSQACGE